MLPQATVRWPHAFNICATSSVVVVLPLVPVMAMSGSSQNCQPSSSSPIISIFRDEKFCASGESGSIPGLRTARSQGRSEERRVGKGGGVGGGDVVGK